MPKKKKRQNNRSTPRRAAKSAKPQRRAARVAATEPGSGRRSNGGSGQRRRNNSDRPRAVATRAAREVELAGAEMHMDGSELREAPLPRFSVVGVGASAGGLEAITQLLGALGPQDVTFAIVIVQHLSPGHESALPELLAARTTLPVMQVTNGIALEPGRVYVVPPNKQMELGNETLTLEPRPGDRSQHMPIDHFFRSLAERAQVRAVGVVLSGSATDGAAGLREIKAAGGITIAQDPRTARYDSMPRAAISTGSVDLVLSPAEIARELLHIIARTTRGGDADNRDDPDAPVLEGSPHPSDEQFTRIFSLLRGASGVDFTHYKAPTIRRRLHRRMVLHKQDSIDQYIRFLEQNPVEVLALYQDILIHVTRFFRDPESFNALVEDVFPRLKQEQHDNSPIRVWVPGCSTGEEAYSVAIALVEAMGEQSDIPIQVFATDVSELAIERARAGIYTQNISADVSPERLRRFFSKVDGTYRIHKQIRDLCVFARQDLTRDPPFSKIDLIVCRNVLIYLGPILQRKLMSVFHYAIKPNGYLMLGSAETIGGYFELFGVLDKRHKIYQKKASATRADVEMAFDYPSRAERPIQRPVNEARGGDNTIQNEANHIILSRYAPPGVVVDSDLKIVQFRGHTGGFLEPAPGDASLDLLKMAREGLLYGLRTAINEARRTNTTVQKEGLRVKQNGDTRLARVEVIPLKSAGEGPYFLILFDYVREVEKQPAGKAAGKVRKAKAEKTTEVRSGKDDRSWRLEQELAASRDYLQSLIQDLEAANEELQSANEEILSANEELQSTNEELDTAKEELQSTNEELNTVNEELQARNEELSRVNSDLLNLLGSVQIAIVMVTNDLRIRRFTPMAERVLNLIPTDVGRPIGDIKPNIECPELERLIIEAIDSVSIKERECRDRNGNPYLLRVRPYKSVENRIDGAVLALFDISEATRRYDVSAAARGGDGHNSGNAPEASAIGLDDRSLADFLESVRDPMIILDDEHQIVAANQPFADAIGAAPEQLRGRSVYGLGDGAWDSPGLRELLETELAQRRVVESFALRLPAPGGGTREALVNARRLGNGDGRRPLLLLAFQLP